MKTFLILLQVGLLSFLPFRRLAADSPGKAPGPSVRVGALEVGRGDIILTRKPAYVHVLFDVFPYLSELKSGPPSSTALAALAKDLVAGPVLARWPTTKLAMVDIVELTKRDQYGAPSWDSIVRLGKFEVKVGKRRLSAKRLDVGGVGGS